MSKTCESCVWFRALKPEHKVKRDGRCHVLPPSQYGFPMVSKDDYCGQWQSDTPDYLRTYDADMS